MDLVCVAFAKGAGEVAGGSGALANLLPGNVRVEAHRATGAGAPQVGGRAMYSAHNAMPPGGATNARRAWLENAAEGAADARALRRMAGGRIRTLRSSGYEPGGYGPHARGAPRSMRSRSAPERVGYFHECRQADGCAVAVALVTALAAPPALAGGKIWETTVHLVRAEPAIVQAACRTAQQHVNLRVTCPTLIPATKYVKFPGLSGEMDLSRSLWAITFNNGENGPGYLHWIAGGGTPAAIGYYLLGDATHEVKGTPRLVARLTVQGLSVALYRFPPYPAGGANGSHTAALVECGGQTVSASIHGTHGDGTAVTAMAVDLARRARCR